MKIAMIGHKAIPSTKGGIETVLTNICPIMALNKTENQIKAEEKFEAKTEKTEENEKNEENGKIKKNGKNKQNRENKKNKIQAKTEIVCYNRTSDKPEKEFEEYIINNEYKGVKLKKAPTVKIKGAAAMVASFTAAIKASFSNCDIVHFHAEGPAAAMFIPKLFGKKCVSTVHGLDWQRQKWGKGFGSKYIKFGEKMLVKYADEVIVLSNGAKEYFKKAYGRETVVIPNGISRPKILENNITEKRFGLKKDGYICMVARLTEEKGVHYLIKAYNEINTNKKLVICGDTSDTDEYVKHLKDMAKNNKNIIFTGFVSGNTLAEIYSNAYLVCLPSDLEGMSVSLLEALSYGNAVLCSDIPENTDVCSDYAETFKKSDTEDLKNKLELLLNNYQAVQKYKNRAAEYVLNRFSWEKTAEKTLAVYKKILKGAKADVQ